MRPEGLRTSDLDRRAATQDFALQTAVVTGAGSGIGRAVALALAGKGAVVCAVGRRLDRLEDLAQEAGGDVRCYSADLTLDEEVGALVELLSADVDDIDVLIHGAGIISLGPVASASVADLDAQYRTNVRAPYLLTQRLLPMLIKTRGQIVFVNSSAGLRSTANAGQYAATKHALKAIADAFRAEVNPQGVRVLSVYPGRTATPMQAGIHDAEGKAYEPERLLQPEEVASIILASLALPRSAEVTEISVRPAIKPP
ncbi:MAG: SDR family oxidoreductase [Actinomycetota bacterium]|nr:SDR family oxidoreductase [Actinomycetota bacterium]